MASTGLFLVCFDSSNLKLEQMKKDYYSRVGTYLDLVDQTAAVAGIKPKIMLVATKVENPEEHQESIDKVLSLAKDQLTSRNSASFLVDGVLKTSSKDANKKAFEDMYGMVFCLCTSEELRSKPQEAIPTFWFRLLAALKEMSHTTCVTTVGEVIKMLQKIKAEQTGSPTIPKDVLERLEKLREVINYLAASDEAKPADSDPQMKPEEARGLQMQNQTTGVKADPKKTADNSQTVAEEGSGATNERRTLDDESRDKEARREVNTVLEFWKGHGELLFYPDNPELSEDVITNPMNFVCSLRTVISHKTVENFEKQQFQDQKLALLRKGLLSYEDFRTIYQKGPSQAFSEEQVWHFLIQLKIAHSLDSSPEKKQILVPCLISDKMEAKLKDKDREFERCEAGVSIQYSLEKDRSSIDMYHRFLETFTRSMLVGDKGGEIQMSYAQKVENKKLGNVAAIYGKIKWTTADMEKPEQFDFLLAEYETTLPPIDLEEETERKVEERRRAECFGRHCAIRFMLKPEGGSVTTAMFEIFRKFDNEISGDLRNVHRCLLCKECLLAGEYGYFSLNNGIVSPSNIHLCSRSEHSVDKGIVEIMNKWSYRQLESLMERGKEFLGLQPWENSDIRKQMLEGTLKEGEQIWVYRDHQTAPKNPVARIMPYSHVMVYVGAQKKDKGVAVHEVVHVAITLGMSVAKISKVDVMSAIQPDDMVFLGHRIMEHQYSSNLREKIASRAIACAKKPTIKFDYDHR